MTRERTHAHDRITIDPEIMVGPVPARTAALSVDEVLQRLAAHPSVDGVLLLGSTGTEALHAASDYDLLIILREQPVPMHVVITAIDQRFTDVIFTLTIELERIAAAPEQSIPTTSATGNLVRWLLSGRIALDHSGRLARAQDRARTTALLRPATAEELATIINQASYNLAVTKRYLAAPDPTYHQAIDLRMTYQLADLMVGYFHLRHLSWQGEKGAVRYWAAHDPEYGDLFRRCLAEPDRRLRVELYEQLARRTVAPAGQLWEAGVTSVAFAAGTEATSESRRIALAFWDDLTAPLGNAAV